MGLEAARNAETAANVEAANGHGASFQSKLKGQSDPYFLFE